MGLSESPSKIYDFLSVKDSTVYNLSSRSMYEHHGSNWKCGRLHMWRKFQADSYIFFLRWLLLTAEISLFPNPLGFVRAGFKAPRRLHLTTLGYLPEYLLQ